MPNPYFTRARYQFTKIINFQLDYDIVSTRHILIRKRLSTMLEPLHKMEEKGKEI